MSAGRDQHGRWRPDVETVRKVLALRDGELVALSAIHGQGGADSEAFMLPADAAAATRWVAEKAGADVTISVGIATLAPAGARRLHEVHANGHRARPRSNEHAGYAWVAADLDRHSGETTGDLLGRVAAFAVPATLTALSGRGVHVWFRLEAPVSVDVGRDLCRRLALALRADPGAADPGRALRLPGTWNGKPDAERLAVISMVNPAAVCTAQQIINATAPTHGGAGGLEGSLSQRRAPLGGLVPASASDRQRREGGAPELVRGSHDLVATLDRICGPSRHGFWRCPSGHDDTASLHLLDRDRRRWVCEGAGHPDTLGRRTKSGRYSGDVVDLLALEATVSVEEYLRHERTTSDNRGPRASRAPRPPAEPASVAAPQASSAGRDGGKQTVADKLVSIALELYELGSSVTDGPFAVKRGGPRVARLLRGSQSLRSELANAYYVRYGHVASNGGLADAMTTLEGRAGASDQCELALRVAQLEDADGSVTVVIDLGDRAGRAVTVNRSGWQVVDRSPVLFRRTPLTMALPEPERGGDLTLLRELVNVSDRAWPALVGALVAAFLPKIARPVILLCGEQGAGKTTAAKMFLDLLDPSSTGLRQPPRTEDDWPATANAAEVLSLDNMSRFPPWLSDALCRAVTGAGWGARKKYSDDDLVAKKFQLQVILTGIDPSGIRGDLASRLLRIECTTMRGAARRTEREIRSLFEQRRPRVLGALFTALSEVLRLLPQARAELPELPRLADFAEVLHALDLATGSNALATFLDMGKDQQRDVLEDDPIGSAVLALMDRQAVGFCGTSSELLDELNRTARDPKPHDWPSSPGSLGRRLHRLSGALAAVGVSCEFSKSNAKRSVTIMKVEP